jgi:hypothetical protein
MAVLHELHLCKATERQTEQTFLVDETIGFPMNSSIGLPMNSSISSSMMALMSSLALVFAARGYDTRVDIDRAWWM